MGQRDSQYNLEGMLAFDEGHFEKASPKEDKKQLKIQNYWNNNTENLSISEGHRKF